MRFYGKKFLRNSSLRIAESRSETKDAAVYDVLPASRVARVLIQGSNKLITAYYPLNWERTPVWLKAKNAVTIRHTGGIRSRIELIGHGTYIPSGGIPIPETNLPDAVLTGAQVIALDPAAMYVAVTAGTYRITGVTYYLGAYGGTSSYITMGDPPPMSMGDGIPMGTTMAWGVAIDPASTTPGYFRIDLITVGADGAVDYLKGTESTIPVVPDLPPEMANHLVLGSILLAYGMTTVTQDRINRVWTAPEPVSLTMTIADDELIWGSETPPPYPELTTDIQVTVIDQYGNALSGSWYISLEFIFGNGEIDGQAPPSVVTKLVSGAYANFTYERNRDAGDQSPMLKATLTNIESPVYAMGFITLLDIDGNPMM